VPGSDAETKGFIMPQLLTGAMGAMHA